MKVLALILILATAAQAQSLHSWSRVTLYSSTALDIATTEKVMRRGGVELNPIAGQNPYRRNAFVIGGTIFTDVATRLLRKSGHRKLATGLNFVISGLHFGAASYNAGQLRK